MAYFPSIAVLALNAQKSVHSQHGQTTTYFDAVMFFTLFFLAGRYLEAYSKSKTGDAVTMLGKLKPREALLLRSDRDVEQPTISTIDIEKLDIELLEVGDVVRVLHGASPPADSIVISGETTFDESPLTEESDEVRKIIGDQTYTGTFNTSNPIDVRVTAITGASLLDHIVQVVREGQTKRAPVERIAIS